LVAEYAYDRNALRDLVLAGDRLVALAAAGHILSFDATTLELKGEQVLSQGATCLDADDDAHVLIGLPSGEIARLNLVKGTMEAVAKLPGPPIWLGRRGPGSPLVAVFRSETGSTPRFWVKDISADRETEVHRARAFLLDSRGRLWLGGAGRTAGLQTVDLTTLRVRDVPVKGAWPDVGGITELADGAVAVYGENPDRTGFVARVSDSTKTLVWSPKPKARDSSLSGSLVSGLTQLVVDRVGHRVVAFSPEDVFVTDDALADWRPLDVVALTGLPGRPEYVGRCPAVGRVVAIGDELVVATARDGLLVARGDRLRRFALARQNPVASVREISLVDGVAIAGDGQMARLEAGHWVVPSPPPLPPRELLGKQVAGQPLRDWVAIRSLSVDPRTRVILAKSGLPRPYAGHLHGIADNLVTARSVAGGPLTILGSEESTVEPEDVFLSPDGQLWSVDPQGLWTFSDSHWRLRGKCPVAEPLRFIPGVGPPWIALPRGPRGTSLIRFDANDKGEAALLDDMPVRVKGAAVEVSDALSWGKDRLLVAGDQGLCVFDTTTRFCELLSVNGLDEAPSLLLRDSQKRVWLAGRGLWLLDDNRARPLPLSLPFLGYAPILSLAALDDGRLVVGLEGRGAAIVSVPPNWGRSSHQPGEQPRARAGGQSEAVHQ
jgi:hypothetical protein